MGKEKVHISLVVIGHVDAGKSLEWLRFLGGPEKDRKQRFPSGFLLFGE